MAKFRSEVTIELVDTKEPRFKVVGRDRITGKRCHVGYIDRCEGKGPDFWFRARVDVDLPARFGPTTLRTIARALEILNGDR